MSVAKAVVRISVIWIELILASQKGPGSLLIYRNIFRIAHL